MSDNDKIKKKYHCRFFGWTPAENETDGDWEHCPNCLAGVHEADEDGSTCGI